MSAGTQIRSLTRYPKEKTCKDHLRRSEEDNGLLHDTTITNLQILAQVYADQGDYLRAELLYERALVVFTDSELYGPWHPKAIRILHPLAEVEIKQGKFMEATQTLTYLQTFQTALYGKDHSDTLRTGANLAVLYDKQKRWQDAEALYKKIIQAREQL